MTAAELLTNCLRIAAALWFVPVGAVLVLAATAFGERGAR